MNNRCRPVASQQSHTGYTPCVDLGAGPFCSPHRPKPAADPGRAEVRGRDGKRPTPWRNSAPYTPNRYISITAGEYVNDRWDRYAFGVVGEVLEINVPQPEGS
uniref:Uncharacterized protein n=1 Tax=Mycobacterium leprae TaxID=1769 RepID=O33055_MYCLR|nr:hypothetical protein MLCB57.26c [Mycobacterium leprae]